jgi:putative SOS response-associated peptidase YedK
MCGRAYETYTDEELHIRYINQKSKRNPLGFKPNYNLAPTQLSPIVWVEDGDRKIDLFQWGLIPTWEKEFKTKLSTINAKAETLFESRLYKGPALKRRCIVPLSGFVEWKREGDKKRPFCIHLKNDPIMSVAGIWETWKGEEDVRHSFSIVTTSANAFMRSIHERMPVILSRENESEWLNLPESNPAKIQNLLMPCPDDWLTAFEVSTAINSPRNNRPEVLQPI